MYRIAITADTHTGHLLGLTPPQKWDDTNRAWLEPLWNFYTKFAEDIGLVDEYILNGDSCAGLELKEPEMALMPDLNDQLDMSVINTKVIRARRRTFIAGTGYHDAQQASLDELLAQRFGTHAVDEDRINLPGGYEMHTRHVVGRSDTGYGWGTQDAKEITNEILRAELEDYRSADLLVRSHVHYCTGVWLADGKRGRMRQAFTTPALQLRGPKQGKYVRSRRAPIYHVGAVLIEKEKNLEPFVRPVIFPISFYMTHEVRQWLSTKRSTSANRSK